MISMCSCKRSVHNFVANTEKPGWSALKMNKYSNLIFMGRYTQFTFSPVSFVLISHVFLDMFLVDVIPSKNVT